MSKQSDASSPNSADGLQSAWQEMKQQMARREECQSFMKGLKANLDAFARRERDLEVYLRALLALIERNRHETPSAALFLSLLLAALDAEAMDWDPAWAGQAPRPASADDLGFAYCQTTLQGLIAQLHCWDWRSLEPEQRYFGVTSPQGESWYNFTPAEVLEAGVAAGLRTPALFGWQVLAQLIDLGRSYE